MANIKHVNSVVDRDFRNRINQLIDSINAQGKSIQDLVAEGQLSPKQYAELIQAVNGLIPRGDVSVLDINKNKGKFDSTYFTSEFLEELNNGTINATNFLPRSVTNETIADNAIDHRVLSDVRTGKNLFDKTKTTANHRPESNTGEIIPHETYHASEYIPTKPGTRITISHSYYRAYYNDKKEHVGGEGSNGAKTFTVPSNTYYICFAVHETVLDKFQVEVGGSQTDYEPFELIIDNLSASNIDVSPEKISTGGNDTIQEIKALVFDTNTRSTEVIRENGRVVKVEEKNGNDVVKTTEIIYSPGGSVTQITETANGQVVTSGIQRTDGQISQIVRGVKNV